MLTAEEKDFLEQIALKHLPGLHDQSTHGRRGPNVPKPGMPSPRAEGATAAGGPHPAPRRRRPRTGTTSEPASSPTRNSTAAPAAPEAVRSTTRRLRAASTEIGKLPGPDAAINERRNGQARKLAAEALDSIDPAVIAARPDVAERVERVRAIAPNARGNRLAAELDHLAKLIRGEPDAPTADPGKPGRREAFKISVAEALEESRNPRADKQTIAAIKDVFTGTFGGLTTGEMHVTLPNEHSGLTRVEGKFFDRRGVQVGSFERTLSRTEDGRVQAEHVLLSLDEDIQGQGTATDFNANAFDWYRESKVDDVRLHADIDVGGYAWARQGYDWADRDAVASVQDRARIVHKLVAGQKVTLDPDEKHPPKADLVPKHRAGKQLAELDAMLDRLKGDFNSPDYPTPFEISQLGRWPGAGRDDWWIGKAIMVGSDWAGVITP